LHSWAEPDQPLRLVEQTVAKDDPDPKALACYGLLLRSATDDGGWQEETWLRFVDGRPVSAVTTAYLEWCCARLQTAGKGALLPVWDNAPWHVSRAVRAWIGAHNRRVKRAGGGVRILPCHLPIKSPWLNPIEPKWAHGKRRVAEPARLLSAGELGGRGSRRRGRPGTGGRAGAADSVGGQVAGARRGTRRRGALPAPGADPPVRPRPAGRCGRVGGRTRAPCRVLPDAGRAGRGGDV